MLNHKSSIVLVLILLLVGAAYAALLAAAARPPGAPAPDGPVFGQDTVRLSAPGAAPRSLTVEVADTAQLRTYALRFRSRPAEDSGTLLLYPEVTDRPLEHRRRPAPVSVAFFDGNGVILRVLEVAACPADCPVYAPQVAYRGRLEVAAGWLARHGFGVGSRLEAPSLEALRTRAD